MVIPAGRTYGLARNMVPGGNRSAPIFRTNLISLDDDAMRRLAAR